MSEIEIVAGGVKAIQGDHSVYIVDDHASPCEICAYAAEHGSWPPDHRGTHCGLVEGACHRSWTAEGQSHCPVCHRHFGSNPAGDAHRPGPAGRNKCQDPDGFPRYETEDGPIWGGRDPEKTKASAQKARQAKSTPSGHAETDESEAA